jgi:hypothetical protein
MPDYQSLTISETLRRINGRDIGAIYLPALQRHFVWPHDKICALFDSLMRDYPIGTFLFWEVDEKRLEESSFYTFIQDYSQFGEGGLNKPAGRSLPPKILGVLDGQQRLNSMYVALLGSYAYYEGGKGRPKTNPCYYLERHFYLNVIGVPEEDSERKYEFALLTADEVEAENLTQSKCWFRVGEIFYLNSQEEVEVRWSKFRKALPIGMAISAWAEARAVETLKKLWGKICTEPLITFYPVRDRSLTEALDIFVRMNHGGVPLHFRDLLFSTIAANWKEGRIAIEKLERELNSVGNGFDFDVNSLMLACLVLSGNPVRMKIESFKPANVDRIRDQWSEISQALTTAVELVHRWSYSGKNAVSLNAVIAIALTVRHGLAYAKSENDLRMFLIRSLICGLYERSAERTLDAIRNYLEKVPTGALFSLAHFMQKAELPSSLSLVITAEDIDELLKTQIRHPRTYVILSLLHGQHATYQYAFEKDHIHPRSKFDNLAALNLGPDREAKWRDMMDRLPNLQLLQEGENNEKRAKSFKDWVPIYRPNPQARKTYLAENDIPEELSLDLADFEIFFEGRRERLRERVAAFLHVDLSSLRSAKLQDLVLVGQSSTRRS